MSTRNGSRVEGARRRIGSALWWFVLGMAPSFPAHGVQMYGTECDSRQVRIIRTGVPNAYRAALDGASHRIEGGHCLVLSYGNDYELLEWYENGRVDAAVLNEVSRLLLDPLDYTESTWPLTDVPLRTARFGVRYFDGATYARDAAGALDDALSRVTSGSELPFTYLPSHLSAGLGEFLAHVAGRVDAVADDRWRLLLDRLRFSLTDGADEAGKARHPAQHFEVVAVTAGAGTDGCDEPQYFCLGEEVSKDAFVMRPTWAAEAGEGGGATAFVEGRARRQSDRTAAYRQWLVARGARTPLPPALEAFVARNFAREQTGFRTRWNFRFTLDELWQILGRGAGDGLALVLTGGGVKAAYQTKLIDHLYGEGLLTNVRTGDRPGPTQVVDYVIGTSGGALLGVFVSSLGSEAKALSETLWKNPDSDEGYIESYHIFPLVDMMRYLSFLAIGVVFGVAIAVSRRRVVRRARGSAAATDGSADPTAEGAAREPGAPSRRSAIRAWAGRSSTTRRSDRERRLRRRGRWGVDDLIWVVLLIAAPWLIKIANGIAGLEQVPVEAGIFYLAYVGIFLYADNRLHAREAFVLTSIRLTVPRLLFGLLALSLIAVPLNVEFGDRALGESISVEALLVCVGFLLLFGLYYRLLATATIASGTDGQAVPAFRRSRLKSLGGAVVIMVAVIVICYGVMLLAAMLLDVPLLELTPAFWRWLIGAAALVSAAVAMAMVAPGGRGALGRRLRHGVAFLMADHPKRLFWISNRYARFLACFILAWLWWNLVSAPALYGNGSARLYFDQVFARFVCGSGTCTNESPGAPDIAFQTFFVISATSLDHNAERYFLFEPEDRRPLASPHDIESDPRWVRIRSGVSDEDIRTMAFASGSPFPVFPARRVTYPDSGRREWLVDGGYAHNIPIQAAVALGATKVLAISSSPLDSGPRATARGFADLTFGKLVSNIPRLVPYFYNRSQIEDVSSAADLLVATISPSGRDDGSWPLLTDFQEAVVRDMFRAADEDRSRRVGMIESWGPPRCTIGGIRASCDTFLEVERVD